MYCTICGKENPSDATFCAYCGAEMVIPEQATESMAAGLPTQAPPVPARTSGLAIASLVCGILGLLTAGLSCLVGLVLGIVGLYQIKRSRGLLHGEGLAVAGIGVSAFLAIFYTVAAILFRAHAREEVRMKACMANLHQLALGFAMYRLDYDEILPQKENWCDALMPYVRSENVYKCPSLPDARCGYAYNAALDEVPALKVALPGETAMLFDAVGGWNLSGGGELTVQRHKKGLCAAFVDGHVRWYPDMRGWRFTP